MIAYRQRGLSNLHSLFCMVSATSAFFIWAQIVRETQIFSLLESVNVLPYGLAVLVGMVLTNRHGQSAATAGNQLKVGMLMQIVFRQVSIVAAVIFTFMFVVKDREISRLFLASYLMLLIVLLHFLHAKAPSFLATTLFSNRAEMPTLFIGDVERIEDLDSWIKNRGHLGLNPVGFLSDNGCSRAQEAIAPYLGPVTNLEEIIRSRYIGQVIMLDWPGDTARLEQIVELCESAGCRFMVNNNYSARYARTFYPIEEGGQHFMALQSEPLEDPINRMLKRVFDIIISLPVVLFVIPVLFLIVWFMQRLQSPGPVFFVRPRGGQNRQAFNMFKFRSMAIAPVNETREAQQATANDPRVFPFGKFMRKASLDEFPQFINVLLGNMSVVGPRPHPVLMDQRFSEITKSYRLRSLVKPGITGLAQVRGFRGEITEPEKLHRRVYWDLYYVTNWSLMLDIKIVFLTAWHVFFPPESAY